MADSDIPKSFDGIQVDIHKQREVKVLMMANDMMMMDISRLNSKHTQLIKDALSLYSLYKHIHVYS